MPCHGEGSSKSPSNVVRWDCTTACGTSAGQRVFLGRPPQESKVDNSQDSDASSDTLFTKQPRPVKSIAKWKHQMETPFGGIDMEKLWIFVAAHVEDKRRQQACPFAEKVWHLLTTKVMQGYARSRGKGCHSGKGSSRLPEAMPGNLASWTQPRPKGGVRWSEK